MSIQTIHLCPKCGSDRLSPTDNFCKECGHDLRPLQTVFPCCGQRQLLMFDSYNFCEVCGAKDPLSLAGT